MSGGRSLALVACGLPGLAGGLLLIFAVHASAITGPVFGLIYGVLFALVLSNRVIDRGSGFLWGLAHALLLSLAVVPRAEVLPAALSRDIVPLRDTIDV